MTDAEKQLATDPEREARFRQSRTGIYVRARRASTQSIDSVDIIELDRASLRAWLLSRGGRNDWAESVVEILLQHDRDA